MAAAAPARRGSSSYSSRGGSDAAMLSQAKRTEKVLRDLRNLPDNKRCFNCESLVRAPRGGALLAAGSVG